MLSLSKLTRAKDGAWRSHLAFGIGPWIEQAMGVNNEVAHAGVIDGALRRAFPGVVGLAVVRIGADEVDGLEIDELRTIEVLHLAADDEVEKLALVFAHVPSAAGLLARVGQGFRALD